MHQIHSEDRTLLHSIPLILLPSSKPNRTTNHTNKQNKTNKHAFFVELKGKKSS